MSPSLICPNCGQQQERNADKLSCIECGAPLQGVTPIGAAPDLDADEPEDAPEVPAGPVLVCPKCGSREEADPDSLFCDQCGTSLKGLTPVSEAPADSDSNLEHLPPAGTCPDCGGQVVEIAPDRAICRKCGEKLISVEARSRNRISLAAALAAGGFTLWLLLRRHAGPF